ncbi:MAG: hypothetical protein IJ309_02900 [Clostridia bacterium]|nr:hypothetical protein [Clostridia bacterium]
MKRIISLLLCVLMVVPCFAWTITAEEAGAGTAQRENVGLYGMTYHSSIWNGDRSAKFINNGAVYNFYQYWEPGSSGRGADGGGAGIDDSLQYCGMKFNNYYLVDEITLYAKKWANMTGGFCPSCRTEYEFSHSYFDNDAAIAKYQIKHVAVDNPDTPDPTDVKWNIDAAFCPNSACKQTDEKGNITNNPIQLSLFSCDKFTDGKYKGTPVDSSFGEYANNNVKYTIKALVDGEWRVLGVGYNDDFDYYVDDDGESISNLGVYTIQFTEYEQNDDGEWVQKLDANGNPIPYKANTKNLRIECSEFGRYASWITGSAGLDPDTKNKGWDEWWRVPGIHEAVVMGTLGYKPEIEVPEGALLSTNAALGGFAGATSAESTRYPGLGNDNGSGTLWRAENKGGGEEFWIDFDKAYTIDVLSLNFGGCPEISSGIELEYDIYLEQGDGNWVYFDTDTATTTVDVITDKINTDKLKTYKIDLANVTGVKLAFKSATKGGADAAAIVTEIGAEIKKDTTPSKALYYFEYITPAMKTSSATGNLACYGTAYCSSLMEYSSVSDPHYIIDGLRGEQDPAWFAENFTKGTYCGVVLKEAHEITKVVLHFPDAIVKGKPEEHVMMIEIQALVDGEYKTLDYATSYDEQAKKPVVSIEFDGVVTNDIRIVYLTNGMVFPYLKELEVYSSEYVYSPYLGYALDSAWTMHGPLKTTTFAQRSSVKRGTYLDLISPIQYFKIATKYGINLNDWI